MKAPELNVTLSTGETVPFSSLYEKAPITLVFLRHFGCTFCKEQVAELRFSPLLNVIFVGMAEPEDTEEFRRRFDLFHPYICDPEQRLYQAFGLKRGSIGQVLGPKMFVRGFGATLRGHWVGLPVGDPWQMPGIFRIETDGEVSWEYRSQHAADVLRVQDMPTLADVG